MNTYCAADLGAGGLLKAWRHLSKLRCVFTLLSQLKCKPEMGTVVCPVLIILVGALDYALGEQASLSIVYLLPIALATHCFSKRGGVLAAFACVGIWLILDLFSSVQYTHPLIPFWNMAVRLGVFLLIVHLLHTLWRFQSELAGTISDRTAELRSEMEDRKDLEHAVMELLEGQRRQIAYELHDGLAQTLTGIAFKAKMLHEDLVATCHSSAAPAAQIEKYLNDAVGRTRNIARGLDPVEVEHNELIAAFRKLAAQTEETFRIRCSFKSDVPRILVDPKIGGHLYRIAQQAIDNAMRHGHANQITLTLAKIDGSLSLGIKDNGAGFEEASEPQPGLGLRIMQFRADLLGGSFKISSTPGAGTSVQCLIPDILEVPKKERLSK